MIKKIAFFLTFFLVMGGVWFIGMNLLAGPTTPAAVTDDQPAVNMAEPANEVDSSGPSVADDSEEMPASSTDTTADESSAEDSGDDTVFEAATDFTANQDGFNFRNYTSLFPEGNLTIEEVRGMFGDSVCTRLDDGTCVPHPKVNAWIDYMNQTMEEVGRCVGFTVASNQLYFDAGQVNALGADVAFDLPREVPVMRTISQSYASYYAPNVWTQEVQGVTPKELIQALLTLDEPVDIGMFYPEYGLNGHSVYGHDVIDQGDGVYHIVVYDSNRPGKDNVIVVDTVADTWFYAEGAQNPDEQIGEYEGDAETKSLSFIPISAYSEPLSCPADFAELCPDSEASGRFSVITIIGEGVALVDAATGQIGRIADALINTVTNGRFLSVRGDLYSRQQPMMLIPSDEPFNLQAQGRQADQPLSLSVTNPSVSVVIDNLVVQPGQIEQLSLDPASQQVDFVAGGPQVPFIEFLYSQNGFEYQVQIAGTRFGAGESLNIGIDAASGDLRLGSSQLADAEITVMVVRLTEQGEELFASSAITLPPGGVQSLDFDGWDDGGAVTVATDVDGDGTFDETTAVENQPIADVLPTLGNSDVTAGSLTSVAPYLGEQTEAVANVVPTLNFGGEALGLTYVTLPSLRPDNLVDALAERNFPIRDLGEFIATLRLDDEGTNDLLDGLGLDEEEKTAVFDAIVDNQIIDEALDEWEFRNDQSGEKLAEFIEEVGLDEEQAGGFLGDVTLPPEAVSNIRRQFTSNEFAGACSEVGLERVPSITFVNTTSIDVYVSWIDYDCVEQPGSLLAPGTSGGGGTWVTHPYVARNAAGELLPIESPQGLVYTWVATSPNSVVLYIRE